jgi:hypothetical protein
MVLMINVDFGHRERIALLAITWSLVPVILLSLAHSDGGALQRTRVSSSTNVLLLIGALR